MDRITGNLKVYMKMVDFRKILELIKNNNRKTREDF